MRRLFWYASMWSDNNHRFNHPYRTNLRPGSGIFPDVVFEAHNMPQAYTFIYRLNREEVAPGKRREDIQAQAAVQRYLEEAEKQ